jgi:predicted GNAT family N-acyltransferase
MQYRLMNPGEEAEVCNLVNHVFDKFVAPHYVEAGIQEFRKYIDPAALQQRSQENHFVLVAVTPDKIVGTIEIRDHCHVCLLFVDQQFQGRGISRELLHRALKICRQCKPELTQVSVNSSPNAVPIYERLGFQQTSPEQTVNGIRFVSMVLELSNVEVGLL